VVNDTLPLLNWADIVLLGIIGISAAVGFWRGFAVEVLSLAAWVLAFWAAFAYGASVSTLFGDGFATPAARLLLGYALLFIAALLVGSLTTWLVGRLVKGSGLSVTDRLLGGGFGLLRGVVLCCILVLLLGFTPFPQDPWWQQSRLLPGLSPGAEWLRSWLPEAVSSQIQLNPSQLPALSPAPDP